MHGLINRSFQRFITAMHGAGAWQAVADEAGLGPGGFSPLDQYEDALTERLVVALARHRALPLADILEDFGVYLVAHPENAALRRLLRFGGHDFTAFLLSLGQLDARARLALPELDVPRCSLRPARAGHYEVAVSWHNRNAVHVVAGVLRAMADDYGALALIEAAPARGRRQGAIRVSVLDEGHATGRAFALAVAR